MNASQQRAVANHRRRLTERGLARYEVRGRAQDKELVRSIAKRLAENNPEAERLRNELAGLHSNPEVRGGFLKWIRSSPLVGLDLDIEREITTGRDIDL